MEALEEDRRYSSYFFLTSALEGGEWLASRPGRPLPPGKNPAVPIVQEAGGGGGRASLDAEVRGKILCLCRGSNASPLVRSQTLYWLSYPAHRVVTARNSNQCLLSTRSRVTILGHSLSHLTVWNKYSVIKQLRNQPHNISFEDRPLTLKASALLVCLTVLLFAS
jgi:hypothetical protein